MNVLMTNRLIQLVAVGVIAAIIGAAIGTWLLPSENDVSGDIDNLDIAREQVFLIGGDAPQSRKGAGCQLCGIALGDQTSLEIPLTASDTVTAGWKESGQCVPGLGRYFTRGEGEPFALMYNKGNDLIGVYHFSLTELPSPFVERPGVPEAGISTNHWGLFIYFVDPTNAC